MPDPPAATPPEFWRSSGFRLLRCNPAGYLEPTDAFLAAYLRRPEMQLVEDSDAGERIVHAKLAAAPRAAVAEAELAAIGDPDVRDNYRWFLAFRDRLVAAGTLEASYLALIRPGSAALPPLLLDHLVHAMLRGMLADCEDPVALRAAELLFRSQRVTIREGAVLLADEETVALRAETGGLGSFGPLLAAAGAAPGAVELDVLNAENAALYWSRSDHFDTVLDLSFGRPGPTALCRVLERWVGHFLGVALTIEPVREIRDEHWSWHIGLDVEASALLDALYHGATVEEARLGRLLLLFRADFVDPRDMRPDLAGRPLYLGLAADADARLRLKPQNLLVNLPLASDS